MNKYQKYFEMNKQNEINQIQITKYLEEIKLLLESNIQVQIPLTELSYFWIASKSQQYFEQMIPIQKSRYMHMPDLSQNEIKEIIKFLQNQELFKMKIWKYRITAEFSKMFQTEFASYQKIISIMYMIVKGYFFTQDSITTKTVEIRNLLEPGQQFFIGSGSEYRVAFEVKIHKIPQICKYTKQISEYKYEHIITFISFSNIFCLTNLQQSITDYLSYQNYGSIIDFTKIKPKQIKQQTINQYTKLSVPQTLFEIKYRDEILEINLKFSQSQLVKYWLPCQFQKQQNKSTQNQQIYENYQFNNENRNSENNVLEVLRPDISQQEQQLINDLLIILTNCQALKFDVQVQSILSQNKNMLVQGQQGSGKTTLALIKMLLQIKILEQRINDTGDKINLPTLQVTYVAFRQTQANVLTDTYQQYEKIIQKFLPQKDFSITPQFITLEQMLLHIDSLLTFPFFRQTKFHQPQTINEAESISGKMEVTFKQFQNYFLKKRVMSIDAFTQIHPQYLWSCLQSYAYGTKDSYKYQINQTPKIKICSHSHTIEMISPWYQKWKKKNMYFDRMDLVNYMIQQIIQGKVQKLNQYFLFVDEVQELPDAILFLFKCITQHSIFYTGDILQTISDSISFFDQNLDKRLLDLYGEEDIQIYNLENSYRGNQQIQKIQNLLINLQHLITPSYLTLFRFESATEIGEKQIIINSTKIEALNMYLVYTNAIFKKNIAILVRNDDFKKEVPETLNYFKIYTIEEAKGLQFEQVILFNFFKNSNIQNWKVLQGVRCKRCKEENSQNINFFVEHKYTPFLGGSSKGSECWGHAFCLELRTLYIAMTRSTQNSIIFDSQINNRKKIEELWNFLYAFDLYKSGIKTTNKAILNQLSQISNQEWEEKGRLFLQEQLYEQSMYCFQQSNLQQLYLEAKALNLMKQGFKLNKEPTMLQKKTISNNRASCYQEAIDIFIQIGKEDKAAECYALIEQYQNAYLIFKKLNMIPEIAEMAYVLGYYSEAGQYYIQMENIDMVIEISQKIDNFEEILKFLNQQNYEHQIMVKYLKYLFPIIFKQLEKEINGIPIPKKNTTSNQKQIVQIIEDDEENGEELEEESDDPQQIDDSKQIDDPQQIDDSFDSQQNNDSQQIDDSHESESFSVQNTFDFQNQEHSTSHIVSFVDKNQSLISQSFQIEKNESVNQSNLEILQKYDVEDEWLQDCDNRSVIQSISGESSDFSVFSYAEIQQNPQIQIVSTQSNIFIEDQIMSKLIKYITLFQHDFQKMIANQEYYQDLIEHFDEDQFSELMFQFDFVDMEFILLMLNILQEFKSYKLCIYVCNRYKLPDNLGNYLVSISALHSPICIQQIKVCYSNIANGNKRQSFVEQGIIGAYAVHSVLEIFNPQFMKLKFQDEPMTVKNSLGFESYQQMIILGFWKKIVYQLDVQNALQVCETYLDFNNWKFIYFTNLVHQLEQNMNEINEDSKKLAFCKKKLQICFTPQMFFDVLYFDIPITNQEISLSIICMEQFFIFCSYQLVLYDIIKPYLLFYQNSMDQKIYKSTPLKVKYPKFLQLTEQFMIDIFMGKGIQVNMAKQIINGFHSSHQIHKYESCLLIQLLVIICSRQSDLEVKIEDEQFIQLVTIMEQMIFQFEKNPIINKSLLFFYKCRSLNSLMFKPFNRKVLVHRTSILMQTIMQQMQQKQSEISPIYFQDIDLEFILIDALLVPKLIKYSIKNNLRRFIQQRNHLKLQTLTPNIDHQAYLKELCFIVGVGYSTEIVHNSNGENSNLLQRYKKLEEKEEKQRKLSLYQINENTMIDQEQYFTKSSFKISKQQLQNELMQFGIFEQNLPNRVKDGLRDYAFYLLRKSNILQDNSKKHKKIFFAFLLLNILNLNNYSIAYAKKNNQKSYIHLVEFLQCCKDKFYTDAGCCFFQYYDYKHNLMFPEEIKRFMQFLSIMQFIQIQLAQSNKIVIKFPLNQEDYNTNNNYLSRYFSKCNLKIENQNYYIECQFPVVQDHFVLLETLNFCQEQFESNQDLYQQEIIQIMLLYLLNIEIMNSEMKNKIMKINNLFRLYYPKLPITSIIESLLMQGNIIQRQNLIQQTIHYKILDIKISNILNEKQTEQLYTNSFNKWQQNYNDNILLNQKCKLIIQKYRQFKKNKQQKQFHNRIYDLKKMILSTYYENNISNLNQFRLLYRMLIKLDQNISDNELDLIEQNIKTLQCQIKNSH